MQIVHDRNHLARAMEELAGFGSLGREGGLSAERPVLIDRFLADAIEVDVDAIRDSTGEVLIGGVMEHVEEAAVEEAAEEGAAEFAKVWAAHYGWPYLVIMGQGPELTGSMFEEMLGEPGIIGHFIDARSPWHNGRAERGGQVVKLILERS